MRRLLKALPLTLALASLCLLGVFAASCGSGNKSSARVVDAISDQSTAVDVEVNGTVVFKDMLFTQNQVLPTPPAYDSVPSGSVTLESVDTGTTTPVINNTNASFSGSGQYTIVMTGFSNVVAGVTAPTFWSISDNNTAPTTGNIEFRFINGSANAANFYPDGLDFYVVQPGQGLGTAAVSGLTLGQGSAYVSENFNAAGYTIYVTPHGNQNQIFNVTYQTPTASIRTLVVLDSGNAIANFLELNDLN